MILTLWGVTQKEPSGSSQVGLWLNICGSTSLSLTGCHQTGSSSWSSQGLSTAWLFSIQPTLTSIQKHSFNLSITSPLQQGKQLATSFLFMQSLSSH